MVIVAVSIAAGATVLFCSWFFFQSIGCGDPWPGCTYTLFDWHLGLVGMILITFGLGLFTFVARQKGKTDREKMPLFISAFVFFALSVLITVVVFNPLISPYDFIRDSDLDGYTDEADAFPHDKDRYMPAKLDVEISWENTSTYYGARIASVYVLLDGEPTDTSVMRLVIRWLPDYTLAHSEEIGTLREIEGVWTEGVKYQDNAPLGLFGLNDLLMFDTSVFDIAADAHVLDDMGYEVAEFQVTA